MSIATKLMKVSLFSTVSRRYIKLYWQESYFNITIPQTTRNFVLASRLESQEFQVFRTRPATKGCVLTILVCKVSKHAIMGLTFCLLIITNRTRKTNQHKCFKEESRPTQFHPTTMQSTIRPILLLFRIISTVQFAILDQSTRLWALPVAKLKGVPKNPSIMTFG